VDILLTCQGRPIKAFLQYGILREHHDVMDSRRVLAVHPVSKVTN